MNLVLRVIRVTRVSWGAGKASGLARFDPATIAAEERRRSKTRDQR